MASGSNIVNPTDVAAADAEASAYMKEGIRLLGESDGNAAEALRCFDCALELRRRLPAGIATHAYDLAACWLNRAEALTRLGDRAHHELARQACDEAIVLLRTLPSGDDARVSKRLAIALQNRALGLVAHDRSAAADAARALNEAIVVINDATGMDAGERSYLLAVIYTNLANVLASDATERSDAAAQEAARRAIPLVASREWEEAAAAEVGLKVRHVLCQTIARRLSAVAAGQTTMPEDVHEATDLADEGLSLVRHWEQHGVTHFRPLAFDLFRFGARVYLHFQPHFLDEFVRENLDPGRSSRDYVDSIEMRTAMAELARFLDAPIELT